MPIFQTPVTCAEPQFELACRGSPQRDTDRTVLSLLSQLKKYFEDHPEERESELLQKQKLSIEEQIGLALNVSKQTWQFKRNA
jgi:hypothetical protein